MTTNARSAAGTGLPTLTRRAALAGLALGASSIASGVALATTTTPTGDERLTALAAEIKALAAERMRLHPALDEDNARLGDMIREHTIEHFGFGPDNETLSAMYHASHRAGLVDEFNALGDRLTELSDQLRALPAVGLAGLAAKAVALLWDAGSRNVFDDEIPEEDHDFTDEALRAFARMLDEMARASNA